MSKEAIHTNRAPQPIGAYSQAVKVDQIVFISGQIPLDPITMKLVDTSIEKQVHQVFQNLSSITKASGSSLDQVVKLTVFLKELDSFSIVNEVMVEYFGPPFPARAVVGVDQLPGGAEIEIDAIAHLRS
ncbi:MAG: reactive intermediate/imine deaminase [Acidiferrobacteraceae bacterium]|nr:reactive intermediate/imine deaminase [Acidiferrobacteraceae bacterium]